MHRANKRGFEVVVSAPLIVAVVVVVDPTLATLGTLGLAHALRAIDATTTRAAKPPNRSCFEVVARLAWAFQLKLLAQSSLLATCSLRGQSGDDGNCRVQRNVNESACDVAVTSIAASSTACSIRRID
jgi:hypothetical protein